MCPQQATDTTTTRDQAGRLRASVATVYSAPGREVTESSLITLPTFFFHSLVLSSTVSNASRRKQTEAEVVMEGFHFW